MPTRAVLGLGPMMSMTGGALSTMRTVLYSGAASFSEASSHVYSITWSPTLVWSTSVALLVSSGDGSRSSVHEGGTSTYGSPCVCSTVTLASVALITGPTPSDMVTSFVTWAAAFPLESVQSYVSVVVDPSALTSRSPMLEAVTGRSWSMSSVHTGLASTYGTPNGCSTGSNEDGTITGGLLPFWNDSKNLCAMCARLPDGSLHSYVARGLLGWVSHTSPVTTVPCLNASPYPPTLASSFAWRNRVTGSAP